MENQPDRLTQILLILLIVMLAILAKIMTDIYLAITNEEDKLVVEEPIGFYKCPKNKKREEIYCPIYPQRRD